jgi:hypothetical protein
LNAIGRPEARVTQAPWCSGQDQLFTQIQSRAPQ